ncbi:Ppx/GppA phosphatase [Parvibaculum lavamentivorans DS-1]|uniref:exopolyphosphatase n=1 Tax=Parvibaculum lavamentivorans (strain DS-1 / DSM 13023 / NCIMB 13966) TaxID=402881 RepID=A7HYE6_PARL1|nr:exopolyphosphatase [Parvibaculum lavamentivorans]ABS64929.1 Ppx/GppA phosphatase [Parvibaculum lavamentivorans DS-1]
MSRAKQGGRFGIVDLGSNSVRLVVYASAERSPVLVFNEKVMAGLGRSLASTGRLDPKGIDRALDGLRRFMALREQIGVPHLVVAATAAVRDAEDGAEFLARAEKICGFKIELLSGADEARISAQGVLSGIPEADGLVGDLGGGSLELVPVSGGKSGTGATLPLGPLRLIDLAHGSLAEAEAVVDRALGEQDWLKEFQGRPFYAVGGVWRNLARIHMAQRSYPIHVLHQYVIPARDATDISKVIEKLGPKSLAQIPDVSERRVEALPFGALVLDKLIAVLKAKEVIISAYGLREGILFDRLDKKEQAKDPLLAGCRDLAGRLARFPQHGNEFNKWTAPLFADDVFGETPAEARLRHAACILADIGWYVHPDYRAHHAMTQILLAPFSGIDHAGRLFLARVGYHRHEGKGEPELLGNLSGIITERDHERALVLGLALRLAFTLSGATLGMLPKTCFEIGKNTITLVVPKKYEALVGEIVVKRLAALGRAIGRKGDIRVGK